MGKSQTVRLISENDLHQYYQYLLRAFQREFAGTSPREVIEERMIRSRIQPKDQRFLRNIVDNAFLGRNPYQRMKPSGYEYKYVHPIELLDYIVGEGYSLSSDFLRWAYKTLGVKWNPLHWLRFSTRTIAPVDLHRIKQELKTQKRSEIPKTLDFYYQMGTGIERVPVHSDKGVEDALKKVFRGSREFKNFDPIHYLNSYYSTLSREDYTITRSVYQLILQKRSLLPRHSTVLIVGNGPIPDDAQTWAMIPEVQTIIPSDIDERNIEIMRMHTGLRNPLVTPKARIAEEHADFVNYLFEQNTGVHYGFFAVREITSVKTVDPVHIDITRRVPLDHPKNARAMINLKADVVAVPFCPESITNSFVKYRTYIKNISTLVAPGKHLYMAALKNATFYISGTRKMNAVPLDEHIVYEELVKNGFGNITMMTLKTGLNPELRGFSESIFVWATKK